MQNADLPLLTERLTELAEAMGARPIAAKGMQMWFVTLREYPIHDVVDTLTNWARQQTKFPAPAQIVKILADRQSDRLEASARAASRVFQQTHVAARDPKLAKRLNDLAAHMRNPVRQDPKAWAHRIYEEFVSGKSINSTVLSFACTALRKSMSDAFAARDQRRAA